MAARNSIAREEGNEMITNPIAFGIAVFFALITIAPKRPGFGESMKDYAATAAGALIAGFFAMLSVSGPL